MPLELDRFHRNVPDNELISDIIRVSELCVGRRVTFRDYNKLGRYSSSTIALRFGSWNEALKKADLSAIFERSISEEMLFENLVSVWTAIGRQPRSRDMIPEVSAYSWSTYAARFGGWRSALEHFIEWANSESKIVISASEERQQRRSTPRNVNYRLRALTLMRDGATCRLCGATPNHGARLEVDHIIPWVKGGKTELENLQILCSHCNQGKGDVLI